jgi:hypothetical protein
MPIRSRSMLLLLTVPLLGSLLAREARAEDKKLVVKKKASAPKLDLGLPEFKEMAKDVKLEKAKAAEMQEGPSLRSDEGYTVVRVVHGKSFINTPEGAKAAAPFPQVSLSGPPLTTEKFSSSVRVKSMARRNARIEVAVLDPRGDTVMEAAGELVFNPKEKGDETEWTVEWAPTGVRAAGEYQVLVRIGGNPLGTFPIKFAETPK